MPKRPCRLRRPRLPHRPRYPRRLRTRATQDFRRPLAEAKKQQKARSEFAADAYKKANKIAGGDCEECLQGLYEMDLMGANWKEAIATADHLVAIAKVPVAKSVALMERGRAQYMQGGQKPKPEQLQASHASLQEAVAAYPKNAQALFLDGTVLAKLGHMEGAKAAFEQCLSCTKPNDPSRLRLEHFAANPALATSKMAPPFTVTALDGSKFQLDAMGGRVVLIDFWATWCGPCNEELPHMKKLAKEFAGQPLVIISVSWDSDEQKWKDFIAKNEMTWVQFRDADHKLTEQFAINAIPHYFTIDADGVLTSEMLGEGSDVEGKLKKLIAKAREAQVRTAVMETPVLR